MKQRLPFSLLALLALLLLAIVAGSVAVPNRLSRLSTPKSAPRPIYPALVLPTTSTDDGKSIESAHSIPIVGKVVKVVLSEQKLYAYENGKQVYDTAVTTGRPGLETPTGTYHIYKKLTNVTLSSPWAEGSPDWFPPTPVHFYCVWGYVQGELAFHDYPRGVFGLGTNALHNDPKLGRITGSHGCVDMPLQASQWLYEWAPIGTTIEITP